MEKRKPEMKKMATPPSPSVPLSAAKSRKLPSKRYVYDVHGDDQPALVAILRCSSLAKLFHSGYMPSMECFSTYKVKHGDLLS